MNVDDGKWGERVVQQSSSGWTEGTDTELKEKHKVQNAVFLIAVTKGELILFDPLVSYGHHKTQTQTRFAQRASQATHCLL
jgi:hypothetical protein